MPKITITAEAHDALAKHAIGHLKPATLEADGSMTFDIEPDVAAALAKLDPDPEKAIRLLLGLAARRLN